MVISFLYYLFIVKILSILAICDIFILAYKGLNTVRKAKKTLFNNLILN